MKSWLQQILDSQTAVHLISILGRLLPVGAGHSLADKVADILCRQQNSNLVRAIRLNQWVVRGEIQDKSILDQAVRDSMQSSARTLFDLYHYRNNPRATRTLFVPEPKVKEFLQRPEFDRGGLVVAGLHISNFDLTLQWLCQGGLKPLILTITDPQGGRKTEYDRRFTDGMNILPTSVSSLLQAIRHLQKGGFVLTGIDRPIPQPKSRPLFFGHPGALPVHHIFLALKAKVPVILLTVILREDGKLQISISDRIDMDPVADREKEVIQNAEKVLTVAEGLIRTSPQQWSISLPVWPELMDKVPG